MKGSAGAEEAHVWFYLSGPPLSSPPLSGRSTGYGGPHDVHHSLPADGQSGPGGLEAPDVGLQLVVHVSSHTAFSIVTGRLCGRHLHLYFVLMRWENLNYLHLFRQVLEEIIRNIDSEEVDSIWRLFIRKIFFSESQFFLCDSWIKFPRLNLLL